MASQFDKLWCLEYDQDSYHRSMQKISFSKYLNNILSNQYFPAFQSQAYKELKNENQWNQRSWNLLQMFQYLNEAFAIKEFQSNVKFIADKRTRKMFGSFRMWIDLQRLYLICFLKMDRIEFQEDRIFFSLYRTLVFLQDLLSQYQISDFKIQFLHRICENIKNYTKKLQKCLPTYMHMALKGIRQLIPNFQKKYALIDYKQKDQIKKLAFRKLSRQYDIMPQVIARLNNNIEFQTKYRQMQEILFISESPQILNLTKEVQNLYDPRIRIAQMLKKQSQSSNRLFDEDKVDQLLQVYQSKQKEKLVAETPYQSLMRTGHNPYDQSNYAIYGQTLGVDMNEKQNLQKKQQLSQIQQEPINQNAMYYDPNYIQKIKQMQIKSVAVTKKDLNTNAIEQDKDKHYSQDNSILLRNLQWTQNNTRNGKQQGNSDDQDDKGNPLTTLRSINLKKNLQNNALFQKHDEEQKQRSILLLKKVIRNGLESDVLYHLQRKSSMAFQCMDNNRKLNLQTKAIVQKSKFDSLRRVAQYHAINKKINKWINTERVPAFYPRGIAQIKRYYTDTNAQKRRYKLAIQNVLQ